MDVPSPRTPRVLVRVAARASLCLTLSGCMTLTPQLEPTDFAKIEQTPTRGERDQVFRDNTIYRHEEPQGTRYTKGNLDTTPKRSWQSLDAVLRSDQNSSEALPAKQLRRSRVFTALAIASSILFVAGVAATARDGFSFQEPSAGNATLLGGALGSVAFAIAAGVLFRRARTGYDRAVDVYNESLGMRLGVMTPQGSYIPPANVMVSEDGYVITEDVLPPGTEGPSRPAPSQPIQIVPIQPAPIQPAPSQAPASQAPATQAPELGPVVPAPRHTLRSAPSSAPQAGELPPPQRTPRSVMPVGALTLLPQR